VVSPGAGNPWRVLGIEPDASVAVVRRSYAVLIKQYRPDSHPEEFSRIREAYERVLAAARRLEAQGAGTARMPSTPEPHTAAAAEGAGALPPGHPGAPVAAQVAPHDALPAPEPLGESPALPAPIAIRIEGAPPARTASVPAPAPRVDAQPPRRAPEPAPAPMPVVASGPADETAPPAGAPPTVAEAAPALEPARRVTELRRCVAERGEDAALPLLRDLFLRSRHATIDERQALEFALLQWFLSASEPPLALMFDAGRAFDWHRHDARLAPWFGEAAWQRLAGLLSMSRDRVFIRHFARNRWVRGLFGPQRWMLPFGATLTLIDARGWAARWLQQAQLLGARSLADHLHSPTMRRIGGAMLLSTDMVLGFLFALVLQAAPDLQPAQGATLPGGGLLLQVLATPFFGLCVMALRRSGRRLLAAALAVPRLRPPLEWIRKRPLPTILLALVSGSVLALIASGAPPVVMVLMFCLIAATVAMAMLWLGWRLALSIEHAAFAPVRWREAVDRWEFEQALARAPLPCAAGAPPYGERLTRWQRLRAIRGAMKFEAGEIARRERPARVGPFMTLTRAKGSGKRRISPWWALWIAITVVRMIAAGH
jgi:hypothetical protein